jgi:hypothetical protein
MGRYIATKPFTDRQELSRVNRTVTDYRGQRLSRGDIKRNVIHYIDRPIKFLDAHTPIWVYGVE